MAELPPLPAARADTAGRKNMLQLVQLRWMAVFGQVVTAGFTHVGLGVSVPLVAMGAVAAGLVLLNLASLLRLRLRAPVRSWELFLVVMLDVAALTAQLFLSGGVTNPFISLFLLQVTLAAVLLPLRWAWAVAAVTCLCVLGLSFLHRPLALPEALGADPYRLHLQGFLVCFVLDAVLLVVFVTRISRNLRVRDARLAHLRQQAMQEEHIVRMGLLASGAAHELGTPLATLSVILGDWQRMPALRAIPDLGAEMEEMQTAVRRCKTIISGILLSAGETRGEEAAATTLRAFLAEFVAEWNETRPGSTLEFEDRSGPELAIAADPILKQVLFNLASNAQEAPAAHIRLTAAREDRLLRLAMSDDGPGFPPEMLARLGQPYSSTKGKQGRGLGLFLVVNVVRKLGGGVSAANRPGGGAVVTVTLPLSAISIGKGGEGAGRDAA
ncbi:ATP-binding protein [Pararoseomonas sp. SCSIO 73927]|uniref:ATP-binding protein n=1 Tax=Pararoseomonas sp. SCSIO 73927 TaxID=3114537 RepID=UPI0030CD9094